VSTPAVTGGAAYIGTLGGDVVSIGLKNGRERWRFKTGGAVPSSPCSWEGVVYVGSNDHKVYALPA
jgi:outer membrane protein assembly factor BamB